ncbi:expressed unknown protein [Seminavis robusta]|uniref:ER membrane protein complex subunit 2 n=1 Tax=Seminavis robusta TaxID=568900 RepID=A0A9N8DGE2_9STRA|nr:expressed unknown protein [Seminavis robusta]|eukprot:Sro139_g064930.2  (307) ;mRNA; r:4941-5861
MGPDDDLPTLIQRKDHLNVLRYIRAHQLRKPELVVSHGLELLGNDLTKKSVGGDESARLSALEQVCLAALDLHNHDLADQCLSQLKASQGMESHRFRRLLARCLETAGDLDGATKVYNEMLQANPANLVALQRKYAMLKAQPNKETEAMDALNEYLTQNMADSAGWYEMAKCRMNMADYKGAAYALEEVILSCPLEASLHCELAEVYCTVGGLENLMAARKHMAQSLELDPSNGRAQFGLMVVANAYLLESEKSAKKHHDEHEVAVAKELIKYGGDQLLQAYKGAPMFAAVKTVVEEYQDDSASNE